MTQVATKIQVGVIGGSGLYHLSNLTTVKQVNPETPWGHASSPITIAALPSGQQIAFIARHGLHHAISPSKVPSRANIAALKLLGVSTIIAFSAVGSLKEEIRPGDFVIPDQIIDRTKGVRPASFFEDLKSTVAHVSFGDPFSKKLCGWLEGKVREVLNDEGRDVEKVKLHTEKCLVCMEGPQFSTRAESKMYRTWGGDIINMSTLPEAKLAREAEISYALVATATDYDSWRPHEAAVTASDVFKTLQQNAETSRYVIATVLEDFFKEAPLSEFANEERGCMKLALMKKPEDVDEEDKKKLIVILPDYFA